MEGRTGGRRGAGRGASRQTEAATQEQRSRRGLDGGRARPAAPPPQARAWTRPAHQAGQTSRPSGDGHPPCRRRGQAGHAERWRGRRENLPPLPSSASMLQGEGQPPQEPDPEYSHPRPLKLAKKAAGGGGTGMTLLIRTTSSLQAPRAERSSHRKPACRGATPVLLAAKGCCEAGVAAPPAAAACPSREASRRLPHHCWATHAHEHRRSQPASSKGRNCTRTARKSHDWDGGRAAVGPKNSASNPPYCRRCRPTGRSRRRRAPAHHEKPHDRAA